MSFIIILISFIIIYYQYKLIKKDIPEYKKLTVRTKGIEEKLQILREKEQAFVETLKQKKDELVKLQENINQINLTISESFAHNENLKQENNILANEIEDKRENLQKIENKFNLTLGKLNDLTYKELQKLKIHDYGLREKTNHIILISEKYKEQLIQNRSEQKKLILNNNVINFPENLVVFDDESNIKEIIDGQSFLMIEAFNLRCDYLINQINYHNFESTLESIVRIAEKIERNSVSLRCHFNIEYIKLKFKECELKYYFELSKKQEKEERKLEQEKIREENKFKEQYEKKLVILEDEEEKYATALAKAKEEMNNQNESKRIEMQKQIEELEEKLRLSQIEKERTKSMAEQTRRGYVYVISNVRSFGKNIYKIGLTRRLEPQDRVDELGDASVPFSFDVHAMYYSEDAPTLEKQMHKIFEHKRVNIENYRKEFFNVDLIEIKSEMEKATGKTIDFIDTPVHKETYDSLAENELEE